MRQRFILLMMTVAVVAVVAAGYLVAFILTGKPEKQHEIRAGAVTHVILLVGQSNMAGAALDIDQALDRGDPRILQYTATGSFETATEPLTHQSGVTGGGPGLAFAREYLKSLPNRDTIVLVPAAYSGVGFSTPDMGGGNRSWDIERPNTSDNVYEKSLVQLKGVLRAIKGKKQIDGVLVNLGGTDALNRADPAKYQQDLDAFISAYRTRLGSPDLPFVLGPSRSDIVASDPGYAAINLVQQNTPDRIKHTAYITGSTGDQYYIAGDALHYNMRAHREMGIRYAQALNDLIIKKKDPR